MKGDLIAKASITMEASAAEVWNALVNPELVKQYMFGATVESDWKKGSPIVWKGEWKGKPFVDKGKILEIEPERRLKYSHFSPLSGEADVPENYHTVTIDLAKEEGGVHLMLSQDHNPNEQARQHSEENWEKMLEGMKKVLMG
jgi:uncharacterized protein YndB with AHSA1/START domain